MGAGLYLHLPFCKQKCNYCDFASFQGLESVIPAYLQALAAEADASPIKNFSTLYVGGGTPSVLSVAQLEQFCALVTHQFGGVEAFAESTFEANPESLSVPKIRLLKEAGFNRISLGLQSFNDTELKILGRIHDVNTFLQTYQNIREAGFTNVNADLIAGQPGQSLESFSAGLEKLISLRPEHLSVYGLQIEEGTVFFERGVLCDQLLMRRMLEVARERLAAAGYEQYEISNFALPGRRAQHNTNYWANGEYVGLGSAAASYMNGQRRQNLLGVREYIAKINSGQSAVSFSERLTGKAKTGETILLGLRCLDGVSWTSEYENLFGPDVSALVARGLLQRENNIVKLTSEGIFLANEVFESFVEPFE